MDSAQLVTNGALKSSRGSEGGGGRGSRVEGEGGARVTRGNQQRLSIHGRSDPRQGAKWEPGGKGLVFDSGLIGVEASLVQITTWPLPPQPTTTPLPSV